jgi:predicted Zn-dependent protease
MMLVVSLVFAVGLAGCGAGTGAGAKEPESFKQERVHASAQVVIPVPASWKVDDSQAGTLIMSDPSDEIAVMFMVVEGEDLAGALAGLSAGALAQFPDLSVQGEAESTQLNGMDALLIDAKATSEGQPVDLGLAIVTSPTGKFLLIVGVADSGKLAAHEGEVNEILAGLRPAGT